MRNLTKNLVMLSIALVSLIACESHNEEQTKKPIINLDTATIEVVAEGGEHSVNYTITNATNGASLSIKEDAEWISEVVVAADKVTFVVDANDNEVERTAALVFEYPQAEPTTLNVKQLAGSAPTVEAFEIEIEDICATSATTKVTPNDQQIYYVMYKSDIQYFYDSGITNDDELFEDDMFYFKRGAEFDDITLKKYMENNKVLFQGVTRATWPDLRPAQKQVLYVYGIEFNEDFTDCTRITDVVWMLIDPPMAELGSATFDVSYDVKGANVTFDVTPQGWDGLYTIQIYDNNEELYLDPTQSITDEYIRKLGEGWISMFSNNLNVGISAEEILEYTCYTGAQQRRFELTSYTLYTAVIFAVDEVDGFYQMVSRPKVINFSTEMVQPSDMTIDINVDNLYVRVCDLKITPSKNDESYKMLLTPTEYFESGYTDEDLIDAVLYDYSSFAYTFQGEVSSHINTLYPSTEYIVVTFGYSGGVITTPVFKKVFTTEAEGECELAVTDVAYGGPYLPSELKALDPVRFYNLPDGADSYMYVMWMEVKTDKPTNDIFTYYVDTLTYEYYGEDIIFFDLLIATCDPVSTALAQYDYDYYICAAAFDYKGNVTPMWRSESIAFSASDARPAEELIEKLNSGAQVQLLMVKPVK